MRKLLTETLALLSLIGLAACGGGGGGGVPPGPAPAKSSMVATAAGVAPLANCPNGGISVTSGIDTNANGVLDLTEVTSTQYVCDGAPGSNGSNGANGLGALVSTAAEAAGANCANGGNKVSVGRDTNSNGVLDALEITSSAYVCNGSNGSNGTNGSNGANGLNSLSAIVAEAAGANCASGGWKLTSGLDTNANGVLNPGEVTTTSYVCHGANGANGQNSLTVSVAEAAGANCATGGRKLTSGLDANANGILDPAEVSATSYVCNGATGATGPAGPGITWTQVTGTTQQAASNAGYMANNAAQVTITLPAAPAVGDIVAVSGLGAGGWKIAQNAGQHIITRDLPAAIGAIWTPHEAVRNWNSIASSWDGSHLVAAAYSGYLYTSTDFGMTWTARDAVRNWIDVASSADGARLVAAEYLGGQLYTSSDSGANWAAHGIAANWRSVASSADGMHLAAAPYNVAIPIYTSSDGGATWVAQPGSTTANTLGAPWISIASSADGSKLIAGTSAGLVFTSADSGVTWTARTSIGTAAWYSVASSADGSKLVAVGTASSGGQVYTSSDAGSTWTQRTSPDGGIEGVTSSLDGNQLVLLTSGGTAGRVYTSSDAGVTWIPRQKNTLWRAVASSWDGSFIAATTYGGQLYTSVPAMVPATTTGTLGSIVGQQFDAIELQCVGNNTFMVLSSAGNLSVE